MSFLGGLFGRKKKIGNSFEEKEGQRGFSAAFRRERINVHDCRERETYVKGCIDQIADAERGIRNLEYEYHMVTSQLTDIEELERLPEARRMEIREMAENLHNLEAQQTEFMKKRNRLSEEEFSKIEGMEEEIGEGVRKLKEAEEYQRLVKSDLRKLNGEKHACEYQHDELNGLLKNYRGIAIICFIALGVCLLILLILQIVFRFDTKLGYAAVVCAAAVVMVRLFLKHGEGQREMGQIERDLNRLTLLQNTVKIRYANNKNLLDYLCLKFHVSTAGELDSLWTRYQEEKKEREEMEQASKDFIYYQKELLRLLRQSRIRDTSVWLHQTAALLDIQEMSKLQQGLINRRKVLREQMNYNRELAGEAQDEIKAICTEYPRYREEIMEWISEAERGMEKGKAGGA